MCPPSTPFCLMMGSNWILGWFERFSDFLYCRCGHRKGFKEKPKRIQRNRKRIQRKGLWLCHFTVTVIIVKSETNTFVSSDVISPAAVRAVELIEVGSSLPLFTCTLSHFPKAFSTGMNSVRGKTSLKRTNSSLCGCSKQFKHIIWVWVKKPKENPNGTVVFDVFGSSCFFHQTILFVVHGIFDQLSTSPKTSRRSNVPSLPS